MDVDQVWHALENHGLKLPVYIIKLLLCTGYDNLQSLSKLTTNQLIEELEAYATDNLDTFDLGLSESEGKYYFSRRTSKFNILPGHKHLIIAAAETAMKLLLQQQQSAEHPEHELIPDEHDQSSVTDDDNKSMNHNGLHFLSEFSTLGNRANSRTLKSDVSHLDSAVISVEEEQHSLVEFLKTWIARKVLSGLLEPFLFDVDYKVQVYRPKSSNQQTSSRSDVYSFVCLRCNTTIRAFKRPNGQNWNAANVCRHISTVHFLKPLTKTQQHKVNNQQYLVSSLSTPPLSDSPIEQDPLD